MKDKIYDDYDNFVIESFNTEYCDYKKNLIENIFLQIDLIFNIFTEDFTNEIVYIFNNMVKINKNKIFRLWRKNFTQFIILLNGLNFIDQLDYLNILIFLIKIHYLINQLFMDNFFQNNIIKDEINNIINKLVENNIFLDSIISLINLNDENNKLKKKKCKLMGEYLAKDYFMYFNEYEILDFLKKNLNIKKINYLENNIIKYKDYFINKYKKTYKKYSSLYFDVIVEDNVKYKYEYKNTELINFNKIYKICS